MSLFARTVGFGLGAVITTLVATQYGAAQRTAEFNFKTNPPCVSKSSPCPLEFGALPDWLAREVAEAKRLFDSGDFVGSQTRLEAVLVSQPDNKIVLYDLALVYLKQGQREKALDYQREALRDVTHPYQRKVLDQLEREILYGSGAKDKTNLSLDEVLRPGDSSRKSVKKSKGSSSRSPVERTDAEIQTVCSAMAKMPGAVSDPSGIFNMAQCAEYEGRLDESAQLYNQYLALEPEALDRDSVALRLAEIETVKNGNPSLQQKYHTGVRSLMTGAFNVANSIFRELAASGPASKFASLEVGILSVMAGRRMQARQYLENVLIQETNTDMRDYVSQLLASEERDNNSFSAAMGKVLDAYDFTQASAGIEKPLSIYPLSPAANTLAVFIALNTNNYPAARRSMDILWQQGYPIFFYAAIEAPNERGALLYRVQIFPDRVTLVHAQVGAKVADLVQGVAEDKPDSTSARDPEQVSEFLRADIIRMRSTSSGLVVETSKGKWKFLPQVGFGRPKEGWPARAFMNDYADLFSSYLGLPDIKLGDESTNSADRWRLVGKIALAALVAYAQGGGGYRSAMQGTSKTLVTVTATGSSTLAALNAYRLYQANMNNALNRFLFRPLVPVDTLSFMTAPNTVLSESKPDSVMTTATEKLPLIQYMKSKTKHEKASAGFATLQLEKGEIRLQDISEKGTSMTVPCIVMANPMVETEVYKETHEGKIRRSESPSPWTTESSYQLIIQTAAKNIPEIQLVFSTNLRRAQVRELLESHCKLSMPQFVTFYVPLSPGKQWHELFHGEMHLGDRKTELFPSCENITGLAIVGSGTSGALEVETADKRKIRLGQGDLATSVRIGSRLSQTCAIPLRQ